MTLEAASQQITALPINKDASSPEKLLSKIADTKPGVYKLHWQVLSIDGHITRGQISFEVV